MLTRTADLVSPLRPTARGSQLAPAGLWDSVRDASASGASGSDAKADERLRDLLREHAGILELISSTGDLTQSLTRIAEVTERLVTGSHCAIQVASANGHSFNQIVAPSLCRGICGRNHQRRPAEHHHPGRPGPRDRQQHRRRRRIRSSGIAPSIWTAAATYKLRAFWGMPSAGPERRCVRRIPHVLRRTDGPRFQAMRSCWSCWSRWRATRSRTDAASPTCIRPTSGSPRWRPAFPASSISASSRPKARSATPISAKVRRTCSASAPRRSSPIRTRCSTATARNIARPSVSACCRRRANSRCGTSRRPSSRDPASANSPTRSPGRTGAPTARSSGMASFSIRRASRKPNARRRRPRSRPGRPSSKACPRVSCCWTAATAC